MLSGSHRVLVIDEQAVVRKGVTFMLERMLGAVDVCEAGRATEALDHLKEFDPTLLILEVALPGRSGIDLVKEVASGKPDLPILIFSGLEGSVYAERALRAGAIGFVAKNAEEAVFCEAVHHVLSGRVYVSPEVRQYIFAGIAGARPQEDPVERLSDRELAVFELIGEGHTRSEIAQLLSLSPKTVGSYRGRIKSKLHLDSAAHLVQAAVQWTGKPIMGRPRKHGALQRRSGETNE